MSSLPIDAVPTRYRGQRLSTIRVVVGGKPFDLGMSGTAGAMNQQSAAITLKNLYRMAGAIEPANFDEQAMELSIKAREFLKWHPPEPKRRGMKRRASWNWKTT